VRWPRLITALETARPTPALVAALREAAQARRTPVLGITGTGGAGKSSLTDELVRRLRLDQDDALRIAVISIDPRGARAAVRCWATASA
jgi:methylmalonyl-CoA mutase